jgi:chromate transporter
MEPVDSTELRPRPASLSVLFLSFTLLALQGFGGVVSIVQRELVDKRRWLTQEEFVEDFAVAQIMPGPNVMNLSVIVGARYFGLPGAIVAMLGMLTIPLIIVMALALTYAQFADAAGVPGALRGMGAVAAGLVSASGLRLLPVLKNHPIGLPACILTGSLCFAAIAFFRMPLIYILLSFGALMCAWTYARLKP